MRDRLSRNALERGGFVFPIQNPAPLREILLLQPIHAAGDTAVDIDRRSKYLCANIVLSHSSSILSVSAPPRESLFLIGTPAFLDRAVPAPRAQNLLSDKKVWTICPGRFTVRGSKFCLVV